MDPRVQGGGDNLKLGDSTFSEGRVTPVYTLNINLPLIRGGTLKLVKNILVI